MLDSNEALMENFSSVGIVYFALKDVRLNMQSIILDCTLRNFYVIEYNLGHSAKKSCSSLFSGAT